MTSAELPNLARIGKLKKESPLLREYEGLLQSADSRLAAAENESNSLGMDERLVTDVVAAAKKVRDALRALGPLPPIC
jgi:hypothetical protein